jgi:adenylyl cyclase-associated protein
MSVQSFQNIIQGPLTQYLQISQKIGGDVGHHSQLVHNAFQVQLQYLTLASQSKQPSQPEIINLLKPTSDQISAIQDFREKNRTSQFFNHLSAISESIPALGWVTVVSRIHCQIICWFRESKLVMNVVESGPCSVR